MMNFTALKDKIPLLVTILVLIIAVVGLGWYAWSRANERVVLAGKSDELNKVWSKGPEDGKVIVELFEDFQCTHCKDFTKDVEPLLVQAFADKSVKIEFKHFPIFSNSIEYAEAAEAAGAQGKFWEYHDKLFENFGNLSSSKLVDIATELKLDVEKFKDDLKTHRYRGDVNADKNAGIKYDVKGTPSIIVDGKMVTIKTDYFKDISDAINLELGIAPKVETSSTTTTVK